MNAMTKAILTGVLASFFFTPIVGCIIGYIVYKQEIKDDKP